MSGSTTCKRPAPWTVIAWVFASVLLLSVALVPGVHGLAVWIALVPALVICRRASLSSLFWVGWAAGYVHCLVVYYWVLIVTPPGGLLLPVYLGLYWPVFFVAHELLARRFGTPRFVAAVALWPLLEWVRGALFTGLPWFYLGHALYRWPRLIQSADIGGVLLTSVLIAAFNGLVVAAIANWARRTVFLVAAAALFAANLAYGAWRFESVPLSPGPTVLLVQPNVPQSVKISPTDEESARLFRRLRKGTALEGNIDVVFWPETIMPGLVGVDDYTVANGMAEAEMLDELDLQGVLTPQKRDEILEALDARTSFIDALDAVCGPQVRSNLATYGLLAATSRISGRQLVAGAVPAVCDDKGRLVKTFNRASHFDTGGREAAYYDKVHLVPFGEYVPFRDSLPALANLIASLMPLRPSVYPGTGFVLLHIGEFQYAPAICFEDTFSYVGRRYRAMGADVLVNLTNDGWFGGSFELEAHLANALFRAIETRMAVVRAANTGISAVVSPRGVVTARLCDARGNDREVEGTLVAQVQVSKARTVYAAVGDWWLVIPVLAVVLFCLLGGSTRGKNRLF